MLAFVVLVPLAVPSNAPMIRRLGGRWRKLHRLIYLAAAAAAIHFIMLIKVLSLEALVYPALVAALLLLRCVVFVRWYGRGTALDPRLLRGAPHHLELVGAIRRTRCRR